MLKALICDEMDNVDGVGVAPGATVDPRTADNIAGTASMINNVAANIGSGYGIVLIDEVLSIPQDSASAVIKMAIANLTKYGRVVVIAPMGDDGNNRMCWPAVCDNVIAVAATNPDGSRASFSNTGSWCDISAPGVAPGGETGMKSGTSYAAALVAGAAALYGKAYGTYELGGFENAMKKAATKGGIGAGILNTAKLFGKAPEKPNIYPMNDYDFSNDTYFIYDDGYISFSFYSDLYDNGGSVVYTIDGTSPSMRDGKVYKGTELTEDEAYNTGISIQKLLDAGIQYGKTFTVKAIAVNGLGVPGKVASQKFQVVGSHENITVTIEGPSRVAAGKSAMLHATATSSSDPSAIVDQQFKWDFTNEAYKELATLDKKTGKLTMKAGKTGDVQVRATHEPTGVSKTKIIQILPFANPVNQITLWHAESPYEQIKASMTLKAGDTFKFGLNCLDKKDNPVSPVIVWTSSNEKVLKLKDVNGKTTMTVEALSKGTATIKAAAQDGSGKSVSCKITVTQPVTKITISSNTGGMYVAPGGSLTLKATVEPKNANNKAIEWISAGALPEGVTMKNGVIKVAKDFTPKKEQSIIIYAMAKDGSGKNAGVSIKIRPKATEIAFVSPSTPMTGSVKYQADGTTPKSVTLLSTNIPGVSGYQNQFSFQYYVTYICSDGTINDTEKSAVVITSSNPKVASIRWAATGSGKYWVYIEAVKAGTSTITVKSADGAEKVSFTVKVITPISGIQISSAGPNGTDAVAYGKSLKLKAKTFSTYGKPSDTKLKWSLYKIGSYYPSSTEFQELSKLVSVSQSGIVSTKASLAAEGITTITVKAVPANYDIGGGNDLYANFDVYLSNPINKMTLNYTKLSLTDTSYGNNSVYLYLYDKNGGSVSYNAQVEQLFTITSSNPKLVGGYVLTDSSSPGSGWFKLFITSPDPLNMPTKATTAKITIKANDGSGKSVTLNVTVQNMSTALG